MDVFNLAGAGAMNWNPRKLKPSPTMSVFAWGYWLNRVITAGLGPGPKGQVPPAPKPGVVPQLGSMLAKSLGESVTTPPAGHVGSLLSHKYRTVPFRS